MASLEARNFDQPDETRRPEKTTVEIVTIAGGEVGRYTFEPGWQWSECIKPIVKTDTCQVDHVGYVVSGTLHVAHDDGSEAEVSTGDVYRVSPGHLAWVVGDEPVVVVEFQGAAHYAEG